MNIVAEESFVGKLLELMKTVTWDSKLKGVSFAIEKKNN